MEHLKFKKKLKTLDKVGEITKVVVEKIQSIPKFNEELRNDLELILHICNVVENEFNQTPSKSINKKQIVIDIITKIFSLRPEEVAQLERHIEFLHSNSQIRKIPYYEKIALQLGGWCLRRFG
jgi:hypothetical protein